MCFRFIGKIALLLVVFGFFMPMACKMNGFEIANELINNSNYSTMAGLLLFLSFLSALAGVVVAVLLLLNKDVPTIIDRIVVFTCFISGVVAFYIITSFQIKSGSDLFQDDGIYIMLASGHYAKLQSGSYIIFIGLVFSFISEISYSVNKSNIKNRQRTVDFMENTAIKICPFCAEEIKKAAMVCKHCGKDVSEYEKKQKIKIIESLKENEELRKEYQDTVIDNIWICGKCETNNEIELDFCKYCGKEYWPK